MKPTLRTSLFVPYLLASALILLGVGAAIAIMGGAFERYRERLASQLDSRTEILVLLAAFRAQGQEWQGLLLRGADPGQRERYWQGFERQEKLVQEKGARLLARLPAGEARRLVKSFGDSHRQAGAAYRRAAESFRASNYEPRAGDQAAAGIDRQAAELLDQALTSVARTARADEEEAAAAAAGALRLAAGLCVALALLAAASYRALVGRRAVAPFRKLAGDIRRLAEGDVDAPVDAGTGGELGAAAQALETLRQRFAAVLSDARQSADALAASSLDLRGAVEAVLRSIEAGSRSSASLASATEQMNAAMRMLLEKTQTIRESAESAAENTRAGNESLRELAHSLGDIDSLMEEISGSVTSFIDSARGIGGMTRQVREIADHTRLLALNAAIEAARAGDNGRGFAVVAEEVRALARNSTLAAEEIDQLTRQLSSCSTAVVAVLQRGRRRLGACLDESRNADQALLQALAAVSAAAEAVAAVVAPIRQQESGIRLVADAAMEVATESERNSATVGRIREAVERLHRCADRRPPAVLPPRLSAG